MLGGGDCFFCVCSIYGGNVVVYVMRMVLYRWLHHHQPSCMYNSAVV